MKTLKQNNNNFWFPNLLDDVFNQGFVPTSSLTLPSVNIIEFENRFEIELAIPGKNKENFAIEIEEDILTVSFTETAQQESEEKGKYTRKEFSYNSFKRTFALPENVNQEEIKVTYENGILKFDLPKKVETFTKEKRSLSIA